MPSTCGPLCIYHSDAEKTQRWADAERRLDDARRRDGDTIATWTSVEALEHMAAELTGMEVDE